MRLTRRSEETEIPTASMADIAFLLIIFFIVTGVFAATRALTFRLPEKEEKSEEQGEPGITIRVRYDGPGRHSLVVDRRPMAITELLPYVDQRLRRFPDKPVLLYTDPDANYGAMVEVYDELMRSQSVTGRRIENIYVPTSEDVLEYERVFGFNPFTQADE